MRQLLLFFFLAAFAVSPMLVGCVGLPNPQSEWTTTEGVGEQPPVSQVQGSLDLSPLGGLDADVPHHQSEERPAQHAAETRSAEGHAGPNGAASGRAAGR
jgi:hypothetical protein